MLKYKRYRSCGYTLYILYYFMKIKYITIGPKEENGIFWSARYGIIRFKCIYLNKVNIM